MDFETEKTDSCLGSFYNGEQEKDILIEGEEEEASRRTEDQSTENDASSIRSGKI